MSPRLRQRWNRISHNAEAVTENAAAGIWSFQHNYINPCVASLGESFDHCTSLCLGDREERARRRRERERAGGRAEYSFDFYDDWYQEEEGSSGILGGWSYEDWDRLLVGSGSTRRGGGEVTEQPARKRGMSYGTRGHRRKPSREDPTVIPSTQPIGFLGKLPWKIGGTLRYKPSAADLQDHPGHHGAADENAPLLGGDAEEHYHYGANTRTRKRSGTTGSGTRDEDAIPLDDEFTLPFDRADDRASNKTRSSKGKRPISRTVSRTTVASGYSGYSSRRRSIDSTHGGGGPTTPSLEDLRFEEERVAHEEDEEIERRRIAAAQLAHKRGLVGEDTPPSTTTGPETPRRPSSQVRDVGSIPEADEPASPDEQVDAFEVDPPEDGRDAEPVRNGGEEFESDIKETAEPRISAALPLALPKSPPNGGFVPARLPMFG
ncbi:unnamed protein product [Parascedosporium putredinis]|uniref:Uncharacterized protein n=1 Tax=Parascedosporium putredinis TaxID=1442378 RepID=A0A9P1M7I1_9PEZI|nr:unnamed protein product [Parascedosporium putredinis]CAI7988385.1 unnamed protein product [Parascedosporium putredinis]